MSVKEAVRFKYLVHQLSKNEMQNLMIKLLNEQSNIISASLFQYFVNHQNIAANVNNIISDTIRQRDENKKISPTHQNQPIIESIHKLDQIPKPLIGHISSFLDQWDYFDLSITNSSIYLGCNTPNMLQELKLYDIDNFTNIYLPIYSSIKRLEIEMQHFHQTSSISHQPLFNELNTLKLSGTNCNDYMIQRFIENNCLNLANVTKLSCISFAENINTNTLTKLLSLFPNLQCLKLDEFLCDIDVNKIKDILPNLIGIHWGDPDQDYSKSKELIHAFADKLQFLSFVEDEHCDYKFSNVNFKKLKHLDGSYLSTNCVMEILQTADNLEEVSIHKSSTMKLNELENIMGKIINTSKSLKYIDYVCQEVGDEAVEYALNGIEKGLFQTKKRGKKEMKVCIHAKCSDTQQAQGLVLNIARTINWLEKSKVNDFMFIWDIGEDDSIDKQLILMELKEVGSDIMVVLNKSMFIISNKDCKINGYHDSWLIPFDL